MDYNPSSPQSIINHAEKLIGKRLSDIIDKNQLDFAGKGGFGQLIEKYHFGYSPNSNAEADFPEAGIELKSSPLKALSKGGFNAKERLVLNIINYMEVPNEDFLTSSFWKKNKHLLLIFYLYEKEKEVIDYIIKLVGEWNFLNEDIGIIKSDWIKIQKKVIQGKAHELSEGDTFYLGACTKGANSIKSFREQPNSTHKAKQRAFSLKPGYVNHIIHTLAEKHRDRGLLAEPEQIYGRAIEQFIQAQPIDIEQRLLDIINVFKEKSENQILSELDLDYEIKSSKNFYARITKDILRLSDDKTYDLFVKSGITVKAIRVEENNKIRESVSFPTFKFKTIYEQSWIESEFKDFVEERFLFVFFKNDGTDYRLEKAVFWNMPFEDRNEVRRVWLNTKKTIITGNIVREIKYDKNRKQIRLNNFPSKSESYVAHVRPHGQNSLDTYELPVPDLMTGLTSFTKQSFWLNHDYILNEIYLKN